MSYVLVTGGAGFIGSNLIEWLALSKGVRIVNVDKLTYAGNLASLVRVADHPNHHFLRADVVDRSQIRTILEHFEPHAVIHLAAETHVDRSIDAPDAFVTTNVTGTYNLLDECCRYWKALPAEKRDDFRFLHVSTDEVFGALGSDERAFTEASPYQPNSPYSATKAAADHLVRAYFQTYDFPTLTTNCTNNFGPRQYPEKLIPLVIERARRRKSIPIYGTGENIRDWLFVQDHCEALWKVLESGTIGSQYLIGGNNELQNIEVVRLICKLLQEVSPDPDPSYHFAEQISYVADRPGHDFRYAVNTSRIQTELGWAPRYAFEEALRLTIAWYLSNDTWLERIGDSALRDWVDHNYGTQQSLDDAIVPPGVA